MPIIVMTHCIHCGEEVMEGRSHYCSKSGSAELPNHPCYIGNGGYSHDWKFQDDSFTHEFGAQIDQFFCCTRCESVKEIENSDCGFYE